MHKYFNDRITEIVRDWLKQSNIDENELENINFYNDIHTNEATFICDKGVLEVIHDKLNLKIYISFEPKKIIFSKSLK